MSFYEEILKGLPASIVSDWPVQVFISHLIKAIANLGHARFLAFGLEKQMCNLSDFPWHVYGWK